jgi:hypothetical protein
MAVRIIELARSGERDPERLRDRVLREAGTTPIGRQRVLDAAAQLAQSGSDSSA